MAPSASLLPIRLATNNIWPFALRDGGYVLVDAGLDGDLGGIEAWDALVEQARGIGFAPSDVRAVVVTHEHIDHAGLTARWAAEGAHIVASRAAWPALVAGYAGYWAQRNARLEELRRHGCPEDAVSAIAEAGTRLDLRWESCPSHALEDAAERSTFALADGRTLRLVATPGHTPGHLVAFVDETGELCSGDALLPTTIPTPGLQFPGVIDGNLDAPRWPSLPPFLASVEAIAARRPVRILPGHGDAVEAPSRLIEQFVTHHARRARQVRDALASGEALCAHEIAHALFPRLTGARIAQAMIEVIGHLDCLEADRLARCESAGGVLRYALDS